jgi:hypothetical protein
MAQARRTVPLRTRVGSHPLEAAGEALAELRAGRFTGAVVIVPWPMLASSCRRLRDAS